MNKHTVSSYDDDLKDINSLIKKMYELIDQQLQKVSKALHTQDAALANEVCKSDKQVNRMELQTRNKIIDILALRQPMAIDLRRLVAQLHIINELERIGDYADNIARSVSHTSEYEIAEGLLPYVTKTHQLINLTIDMLGVTMRAFFVSDYKSGLAMPDADKKINQWYEGLFEDFIQHMEQHPDDIRLCTRFLFMVKQTERIGDRVVNIAENIYYIIKGDALGKRKAKK